MKPQDVRFYHIRDHPWPRVLCDHCGTTVPYFHRHWTRHTPDAATDGANGGPDA
jgi:hypothetical protein